MIKDLLTGTAIFLLACQATAQITLTAQTSAPQIGDNNTYKSVTNPSIDQLVTLSGANQTWDYSTISGGTDAVIDHKNPSTFSNISIFPTATIGYESSTLAGNSAETYMKTNSTSIEVLGLTSNTGTNTQVIKNEEGHYLLKFPMAYNTEYTDSLKAEIYPLNPPGSNFTRRGVSTMKGEGYGDLILPYGTVNDVLRVRIERTYTDYFNNLPLINYVETSYYYYTDYNRNSIAQYNITMVNGVETINSFNYLKESSFTNLNTVELNNIGENKIFPNPANSNISISNIKDNTFIEIMNTEGKLIQQLEINSNNLIDISELTSGFYFINLKNNGTIKTLKFTKK